MSLSREVNCDICKQRCYTERVHVRGMVFLPMELEAEMDKFQISQKRIQELELENQKLKAALEIARKKALAGSKYVKSGIGMQYLCEIEVGLSEALGGGEV